MSVGAGDEQIRTFVLGEPDQERRKRAISVKDDAGTTGDVVTVQITGHVVHALPCGALFSRRAYFHDRNPRSLLEERERVAHDATRFARILPADHNMVCSQHSHPFGADERWAACPQNHSTGIERAIDIPRSRVLPNDN